jgi:hypothetical protein
VISQTFLNTGSRNLSTPLHLAVGRHRQYRYELNLARMPI